MRIHFLAGFLALATPALADTIFSSGSMIYSGSGATSTRCSIYNAGTKSVAITSVGIIPYDTSLGTTPVDFQNCLGTPLAPDATCAFTGTLGVYGGGVAKVKGSTKSLRGNCTLYTSPGFVALLTEPMR